MGLLDFTSKVLTEYRADISDHKDKVKQLTGAQKELAQAELEAAKERNKQADSIIDKLGKWALGVGAVVVAVKAGFDSIEFAGKRADLASAAAGVSIEGLRKATFGLRTDTELLTTAAKLNHSVFTLTQADMETAAKAMTALGERGGDAQEAVDAVTEALVTGKTKGLKQYGIEVDETKDKAAKFRDIMKSLSGVAGEVSESSFDASDKVSMLKVSFSNAIDDMKLALGKLAMALAPLLDLLAKAVGLIARAANATFEGVDQWMLEAQESRATGGGALAGGRALGAGNVLNARIAQLQHGGNFTGLVNGIGGQVGTSGGIGNSLAGGKGGPSLLDLASGSFQSNASVGQTADGVDELVALLRSYQQRDRDRALNSYDKTSLPSIAAPEAGFNDSMQRLVDTANAKNYNAFNKGKTTSFLESTFGPVDQFNIYKSAFDGFTQSVQAGYTALVTGSEPVGKAFKHMAAQSLLASGAQLMGEGIKNEAYALGYLITGNFAQAAASQVAAAKDFAGAAALGILANQLGAGGSSSAKPGSGGGGGASAPNLSTSGAAASPSSGPTIIVAYGDAYADDNPRARQLQAEKVISRAVGNPYVQRS